MSKQIKKIVNNFSDKTSLYLQDISNIKVLSHDEHVMLWKDYKINNNLDARDKLITSNLKFVAKIALTYQNMGLSYADLIAEGNMGLIKAIDKYDGNMGFKLTTYSVWWIKQSIIEAIQKRNGLMIDVIPDENIHDDIDCEMPSLEVVNGAFNDLKQLSYYDDSEQENAKKDRRNNINIMISTLNEREKLIINQYYGLDGGKPRTLEEIGEELNLTKERVRQINEKALKKLRACALTKKLNFSIY